MCLNLTRRSATEERHRRASLWAEPSIPKMDATDATSPMVSSQYQPTTENPSALMVGSQSPTAIIISPQNQNLSTVPSLVASSQYQTTTVDPSVPLGSQSPLTAITSPKNQNLATVPSVIASSQYQTSTVNPSVPLGSQSPPTAIISPQNQNLFTVPSVVASSQYQTTTVDSSVSLGSQFPPTAITSPQNQNLAMVPSVIASSQYQTTTVNPSAPLGFQSPTTTIISPQNENLAMVPSLVASSQSRPTAIISPLAQTTAFDIQQATFNFHDSAMLQKEVAQHPRAESPMTYFLNSTSRLDSYNWGGENTSVSFNPSNPFDLFSSVPSSDSGPLFEMDQQWKTSTNLNTSGTSLLDPIAPTLPTSIHLSNTTALGSALLPPAPPTSRTADGFIPVNSTSMSNNTDSPPTSTTADGFKPVNNTELALNTATNTLHVTDGNDGTSEEGVDNSKKRKSYEERNAHCILPEGSRRARKGRCIEGAEDENTGGPKKRNANVNKKGKGRKK